MPAALPTCMRPLDPAIKKVWTINLALVWAIPFVIVLIYEVTHIFAEDRSVPLGVALGLVVLLAAVTCVFIPRLRYRFWQFELFDDELYLERGIFNRVRTIVPLRRIQHLDVSQNLIEREFDLGKLIVHTAGTRSSDVVVPGLRNDVAEGLRDEVKRYLLEDPL